MTHLAISPFVTEFGGHEGLDHSILPKVTYFSHTNIHLFYLSSPQSFYLFQHQVRFMFKVLSKYHLTQICLRFKQQLNLWQIICQL